MKKKFSVILNGLLILLIVCSQANKLTVEDAIEQLRNFYFSRNFEAGYYNGKNYIRLFPKSLELKAWNTLNALEHFWGWDHFPRTILNEAEQLINQNKNNPWSYIILSAALRDLRKHKERAIEACYTAVTLAPNNQDIVWFRAKTLVDYRMYDDANTIIDNLIKKNSNSAELLVLKGRNLKRQAINYRGEIIDEQKWEKCIHYFKSSVKHDSACTNAYYHQIGYDNSESDYNLLKQGLKFSPLSKELRSAYWKNIFHKNNKSFDEKLLEIETDIKNYLNSGEHYPGTYKIIRNIYSKSYFANENKQREFEDKTLNQFPKSFESDVIGYSKIHVEKEKSEAKGLNVIDIEKNYRKGVWSWLSQPRYHPILTTTGFAYRSLFNSVKRDTTASIKEIYKIIDGWIKYEIRKQHIVYSESSLLLAERVGDFEKAKEIAQIGIEKSAYRKDEVYDALGWVHFLEGDFESAENQLIKGYNFNKRNVTLLYHLGTLYENKGHFENAERYFSEGVLIKTNNKNPNEMALKSLYNKGVNNSHKYDKLISEVRKKRKREVLSSIISNRLKIPEFQLSSLNETQYSTADLIDKVTVINFWGVWCWFCKKEMPEFQMLYDKYRNDPNVLILSIDNDPDKEIVKPWMIKNHYSFPVLYDDGYVAKADIKGFPTTWFIDRDGRIAYIKSGFSKYLLEEFSWRIESLK